MCEANVEIFCTEITFIDVNIEKPELQSSDGLSSCGDTLA